MTRCSARAVAEQFIREGIARADPDIFDQLVAENIVVETGLSPMGPIIGRDAYKEIFMGFAEAWPVSEFTVNRIDEAGQTTIIEFTAVAEFAHDYFGVPATHQLVPLREIHRIDVMDGRVVRNLVGAINLPFEFIMYPALRDAVLGGLEAATHD